MKRLKPIAGIVFVFVLGALTGALTAHFYSKLESARPDPITAGISKSGWRSSWTI